MPMPWWKRLMHPWWRPVGIILGLVGIIMVSGSWVFDYSNDWLVLWYLAILAINVLNVRQLMRDVIAAENRERSRPTDLTPRQPPE